MTEVWWIGTSLAVISPAMLIAVAPRRFLVSVVLAWTALPVLLYAALIGWEMLTRPPTPNPLGTALYGLMVISPILAVPWLMVCAAGFGLGFGIRRLLRTLRLP